MSYYKATGHNSGLYHAQKWLSGVIDVYQCDISNRYGDSDDRAVLVEFKDPCGDIHRVVLRRTMTAKAVRGVLLASGLMISAEPAARKLFQKYIFGDSNAQN